MTYRSKTTLAVFSLTLACLVAFAGFTMNRVGGALLEAAVQRLEAVADSRVSEIEGLIQSYHAMANLVVSRTRLREILARVERDKGAE